MLHVFCTRKRCTPAEKLLCQLVGCLIELQNYEKAVLQLFKFVQEKGARQAAGGKFFKTWLVSTWKFIFLLIQWCTHPLPSQVATDEFRFFNHSKLKSLNSII